MGDPAIGHGPTQPATPPTAKSEAGEAERLAPGTACGEYLVERFLGAGAMGEVYAGIHPVIGKRVAIKLLRRSLAASAEAAERFVREARAVNQVAHPNVIDVFGFGRTPSDPSDPGPGADRLYLVMDLVEGRTLRAVVEDGPLEVATALDVLDQIADALDAAHARGVVHRDLKPDNVMLGAGTPPQVHVLDFGIAKLVAAGEAVAGNGTLTGQGTWLGTPGYMAPEQWSADGAGPASDRYALGVMAFELLAGKLPFQATTLPQMMEQHFRAPVPALSARGAVATHATFDPVLARAMAKDPDHRFATARQLVDALRAAVGKPALPAALSAALPRRWWLPASLGAGVLGISIVAVVAARGGPATRAGAAAASGFARLEVKSRPAQATVLRGDRLYGTTPASFEVRIGERVELTIKKPGYTTMRETVTAEDGRVVDVALAPQNGFEGVWILPDGQLRAFARSGEQVDVFKLASLSGPREFYRKFDLVEEDPSRAGSVRFAAHETIIDERLAHESCQLRVRIEYDYDPQRDALAVRPEDIETAIQDGRCVVHQRTLGAPVALVRADHQPVDTRLSRAPYGRPMDAPSLRQVGEPAETDRLPSDTLDNPSDVPQKTIPRVDDVDRLEQRKREQAKQQAAKQRKQPPPRPPPVARPPSTEGKNVNNAKNAKNAANLPLPQAEPAQQAQQATEPEPPRGGAQVAPQVQRKN